MNLWTFTFFAFACSTSGLLKPLMVQHLIQHFIKEKPHCILLIKGLDYETSALLAEKTKTPIVYIGTTIGNESASELTDYLHLRAFCVMAVVKDAGMDQNFLIIEHMLRKQVNRKVIIFADNSSGLERLPKKNFTYPTIIVRESKDNLNLQLICPDRLLQKSVLWQYQDGIIAPTEISLACQHPLHGKNITISSGGFAPYIFGTGKDTNGVDVQLAHILAKKFKFTFSVEILNIIGKQIPGSKKWLGVVGKVMNGTSGFGLGNIALDASRFSAVDFSTWLYQLELVIISPTPKLTPYSKNLMNPFSFGVWIAVLIALLIVTFLMLLIVHATQDSYWTDHKLDLDNIKRSTVWLAYIYLLQNDPFHRLREKLSRFPSLQVLILFWSAFTLVIGFAYTCNLRAFLMQRSYERPIDSAKDILDRGVELYMPEGAATIESFRTSINPVQQELYKQMIRDKTMFTLVNGWLPPLVEKKLLDENGVFILPKEIVQTRHALFQAQYGRQPFYLGKDIIFSYNAGFIVPKFTSWKIDFDKLLSTLVERGFVDKFKALYLPRKEGSQDKEQLQRFTLEHLMMAYVILAAGIVLSWLTFLREVSLEKVIWKKMRKILY